MTWKKKYYYSATSLISEKNPNNAALPRELHFFPQNIISFIFALYCNMKTFS